MSVSNAADFARLIADYQAQQRNDIRRTSRWAGPSSRGVKFMGCLSEVARLLHSIARRAESHSPAAGAVDYMSRRALRFLRRAGRIMAGKDLPAELRHRSDTYPNLPGAVCRRVALSLLGLACEVARRPSGDRELGDALSQIKKNRELCTGVALH